MSIGPLGALFTLMKTKRSAPKMKKASARKTKSTSGAKNVTDTKEPSTAGIVTLLLKDHRAMKELMSELREEGPTNRQHFATFKKLERLVHSHMIAEEKALLERIKDHPKFKDEAVEGLEEHEIHRVVINSIHQVQDPDRRYVRMKSFCEVLEHHLREEEEDLFPKFKKYTAKVTRRRIGREFLKTRKKSNRNTEDLGALEPSDEVSAARE